MERGGERWGGGRGEGVEGTHDKRMPFVLSSLTVDHALPVGAMRLVVGGGDAAFHKGDTSYGRGREGEGGGERGSDGIRTAMLRNGFILPLRATYCTASQGAARRQRVGALPTDKYWHFPPDESMIK